jgi:hypothetical protein
MMDPTIILIGPIRAGKSVIAELVAKELHLPHYSLDDERWTYYHEIGYDEAEASRIAKSEEGMLALLRYWKPFEAHSVERIVAEHTGCVIDFGAGHSFYEDDALFSRVQAALAPYPNVFLLLPSPDPDESVRVLNERFAQLLAEEVGEVDPRLLDMNEQFVRHPSNYRLAKKTIYTNGKTPAETCAEIVGELGNG